MLRRVQAAAEGIQDAGGAADPDNYLMSVTEKDHEAEVHQAIQWLQDEFLPLKENIMTLPEQCRFGNVQYLGFSGGL